MLVRFVVDNLFSFGEEREFNMLPRPRLRKLEHHKYAFGDIELLKLAAIYGPNGAGKSNLVKAIALLKEIVVGKTIPYKVEKAKFRLGTPRPAQKLGVQFVQAGKFLYYGLEIHNMTIRREELYELGTGKQQDRLIYACSRDAAGKADLRFATGFEDDPERKALGTVIQHTLLKPNETILKTIGELNLPYLPEAWHAWDWFMNTLVVLLPEMKATWLPEMLDREPEFAAFADRVLKSMNLGIEKLEVDTQVVEDQGDWDGFEETMEMIVHSPMQAIAKRTRDSGIVVLSREGTKLVVKKIMLRHTGLGGVPVLFELGEESDGTNRLLDFVPLLHDAATQHRVYVVDELERSLHPNMIKEVISKISNDVDSKGQIIFTTHESNLLDQDIFRQDEIWFAEKDLVGCTDLYSLSDFKEHATIDIRKGYLTGRYGSVPFLGNLRDLNWHSDAPQL